MSLRKLMLLVALSGPGIVYAADLFTATPSPASDVQRTAQNSALDRLRAQRTVHSAAAVGVNVSALDGESVSIDLPGVAKLKAKAKKIDRRGPEDLSWYGELPGTPGTATLVVRGGRVTGTIRHNKELYRIVSLGDGAHALVRLKEGAFPPDHPAHETVIDGGAVPPLARAASGAAGVSQVIDVLVTYTPAAENRAGDILGLIQLAVDETNQAYANSNINLQLRLVHAYKSEYAENGRSFDTIKGHLANSTDNNFQDVHALRNQYGADVVIGIINQDDACGSAYSIMANANTAFAVVHWDCATGYYSFAHEIGHLQGARHDPDTDSSTRPFAYGHGYRYKQEWRTVMAYDCPNDCPRLQYFSNPKVLYNGIKMGGVKKSNNARVLNETAATVAGFRPTAP